MLAFVLWLISAAPLVSHCAPTVFVDQIENGSAVVISQDSGAAWNMGARYLPAGTVEGDTVHLCGYFKFADDGIEGTPEGDAAVAAEAKRAALGASDPGGTIYLSAPVTAEGR